MRDPASSRVQSPATASVFSARNRAGPADSTDTGIRDVKFKAMTDCEYTMRAKLVGSDLTCLDFAQSPWIPSLIVGDDCGDVGCPVVEPDRALCPGTCGNGDASDPGDQCDGNDDALCPGACDSTCACP